MDQTQGVDGEMGSGDKFSQKLYEKRLKIAWGDVGVIRINGI